MMPTPEWSVVVATVGGPRLERCLESLSVLDHPSFELLVVDNRPDNPRARAAAERFSAIYLAEPRPGLSRARNAGARAASGEHIAFLDDDSAARANWLSAYQPVFAEQRVAAATGRIHLESAVSPAARRWAAVSGEDHGNQPQWVDASTDHWFELTNFGGLGRGGNMAMRRSLFTSGWAFREDLGLPHRVLGEDHYAMFDLVRRGWTVAYVPEAGVDHPAVRSEKELRERRRRVLRGSSGYMAMLLAEEPGFRKRVARYAWEGIRGVRRPWRTAEGAGRGASRLDLFRAGLEGCIGYVATRFRQSG
jgi:glycosyltransferase involved in cell wall biosynthesis